MYISIYTSITAKKNKENYGVDMQLTETQELTMDIARVGYESYCNYTDWKSVITGDNLPEWNALPANVVNAWFAASDGMINELAKYKDKELIIVD